MYCAKHRFNLFEQRSHLHVYLKIYLMIATHQDMRKAVGIIYPSPYIVSLESSILYNIHVYKYSRIAKKRFIFYKVMNSLNFDLCWFLFA